MVRHFLLLLLVTLFSQSTSFAQNVKFGIITDLHNDIMADSPQRLAAFHDAATKAKVDFVIDLGDFAMPKPSNRDFANQWIDYPVDKYNVLGNHDMDNCTKEEYMEFMNMDEPYYYFEKGDFRFIVLDANNLYDGKSYTHYANANFYVDASKRAWIDPTQLEWLTSTLAQSTKRCIIFSHQSLEYTVTNGEQVRAILEDANKQAGYAKVVAAFSGHDHTDYTKLINGITYIQINSSSNQWVGEKYKCTTRYPKEVYERRPSLAFVVPYRDPLFAIVTLTPKSLKLKGVKSEFLAPTPTDLGIPSDIYPIPLTPTISDVKLKF